MVSLDMAMESCQLGHNCLHGTFCSGICNEIESLINRPILRNSKRTCKEYMPSVAFHQPSLMDGKMHQHPWFSP